MLYHNNPFKASFLSFVMVEEPTDEEKKEIEEEKKKELEEKEKLEQEKAAEGKKESESKSIIEQAREERKKNEEVLERMKEEREKAERLASELALAGKSTIDTTPEPTEHDKYVEKAKERYAGTGRDPTIGFKRKF